MNSTRPKSWLVRALRILAIVCCQFAPSARADVIYLADSTNNAIVKLVNGNIVPFASGLNGPAGMAFDDQGNLYCANSNADSISKITPGGSVSTFATGMNHPQYLAYSAGNLYASNGNATAPNYEIYKITSAGTVTPFATPGSSGIVRPNGLAFDSAGNLYCVDYGQTPSNVLKFATADGSHSFFTHLLGANAHARGFDLAFDGVSGTFDCVDDIAEIEKITGAGAVSTLTPSPSDQCSGMAFDSAGNAYTLGRTNLYQITPAGAINPIPLGGGNYQYQSVVVQIVPEPSGMLGCTCAIALLAKVGSAHGAVRSRRSAGRRRR
jgi:hypothetical protein